MHETRYSKLVHWGNAEGWAAKGSERGVQDGGDVYTHG